MAEAPLQPVFDPSTLSNGNIPNDEPTIVGSTAFQLIKGVRPNMTEKYMTADVSTGQYVADELLAQVLSRTGHSYACYNCVVALMHVERGCDWKLKVQTGPNQFLHLYAFQPHPSTRLPVELKGLKENETEVSVL